MRLLWRYWCSEMVAAEEWDAGSMLSSFAALRISESGKSKKPSLAEIEEVLRAEHEERGCSMTVLRREVPVCSPSMDCMRSAVCAPHSKH